VVVLLFFHVVILALKDLRNDLVDAEGVSAWRVSLLVPAVGLTIAATETYRLYGDLPAFLAAAQAPVPAALSFAFAFWTTACARSSSLPRRRRPSRAPTSSARPSGSNLSA
jgi:hypothetical protein